MQTKFRFQYNKCRINQKLNHLLYLVHTSRLLIANNSSTVHTVTLLAVANMHDKHNYDHIQIPLENKINTNTTINTAKQKL